MSLSKFQMDVKGLNLRILFLRRLVVLVLVCVQPVSNGVVINDVPIDRRIDTLDLIHENKYPILHRPSHCSASSAMPCHIGYKQKGTHERWCYDGQRPKGYNYQCVDTSNGPIEFFSPDETCERGTRKVPIILSSDFVYLRKETCPDGYHQIKEGDCLGGCSNKHPSHPPDMHVVVIKEGTRISIGIGNCEEGYINLDKKLYFRLDAATGFHCKDRNDYNQLLNCSQGDTVLTNMTCVEPCHNGTVRNPWDGTCVPANYLLIEPTTSRNVGSSENPAATDDETQPTAAPDPPKTTGNEKTEQPEGQSTSTLIAIICAIVGVVVVLVLLLVIGACIYFCKSRKKGNGSNSSSPTHSMIEDSIEMKSFKSNGLSKCSDGSKTVIKNVTEIGGTRTTINSDNTTVHINYQCDANHSSKSSVNVESADGVDEDGTITDTEREPLIDNLKSGITIDQAETIGEQPDTDVDVQQTEVKKVVFT